MLRSGHLLRAHAYFDGGPLVRPPPDGLPVVLGHPPPVWLPPLLLPPPWLPPLFPPPEPLPPLPPPLEPLPLFEPPLPLAMFIPGSDYVADGSATRSCLPLGVASLTNTAAQGLVRRPGRAKITHSRCGAWSWRRGLRARVRRAAPGPKCAVPASVGHRGVVPVASDRTHPLSTGRTGFGCDPT